MRAGANASNETGLLQLTTVLEKVGTERVRQHRERRRNGRRLMTLEMPEATIEHAIARELLKPENCTKAWPVIQACYASLLSEKAMQWLVRNGVINDEERGDTAAILRRISNWLEQATT
jgi:hypothetical protein